MQWLVRDVWPEASHGVIAGAKKTFKSYNALALGIAVASGAAYLDTFEVVTPGPVLIYNGEGGMAPYRRRYQRICEAYDVPAAELPFYAVEDARGSLEMEEFIDGLKRHLDEVQPVLFILDPLYAFHPANIEAQNLYSRGRMLREISVIVGNEIAFAIVDHYRKSAGKTLDLDEIGQSGMSQWADTWIGQTHREPPDFIKGDVFLLAEYGTRRLTGKQFDVTWHMGVYDHDTDGFDRPISWEAFPADGGLYGGVPARLEEMILDVVCKNGFATQTRARGEVRENARLRKVEFSSSRFAETWAQLVKDGRMIVERRPVLEGSRMVTREVAVPTSTAGHE